MSERLRENPVQNLPAIHTEELPINSFNFVDTVITTTRRHLDHNPTALKVGNIVHDIYNSYVKIRDIEAATGMIAVSPISEHAGAMAFNELLRAFNIAWYEQVRERVRNTTGAYAFSWLSEPSQTDFYTMQYQDEETYLNYQFNLTRAYLHRTPNANSLRTFIHVIQPNTEFLGVCLSTKGLHFNSFDIHSVGIKEVGKGNTATQSILARSYHLQPVTGETQVTELPLERL